jgi:plastocyanin
MSGRCALLLAFSIVWGCVQPSKPPLPDPVLTISAYAYSPSNLSVAPGTSVTVINRDVDAHSVTSTNSSTAFVPATVNGVFLDTGAFRGTTRLAIPRSARPGTVIPFFCTEHGRMMGTGTFTIVAP